MNNNTLITVCSECKRACCWQGEFMCDDAINASTKELSVKRLKELSLEHSDYWEKDYELKNG